MAEYAMEFSKLDPKLNVKERNILSEAFKNVVGSRKSACHAITSIEEKEEQKSNIYFYSGQHNYIYIYVWVICS